MRLRIVEFPAGVSSKQRGARGSVQVYLSDLTRNARPESHNPEPLLPLSAKPESKA